MMTVLVEWFHFHSYKHFRTKTESHNICNIHHSTFNMFDLSGNFHRNWHIQILIIHPETMKLGYRSRFLEHVLLFWILIWMYPRSWNHSSQPDFSRFLLETNNHFSNSWDKLVGKKNPFIFTPFWPMFPSHLWFQARMNYLGESALYKLIWTKLHGIVNLIKS